MSERFISDDWNRLRLIWPHIDPFFRSCHFLEVSGPCGPGPFSLNLNYIRYPRSKNEVKLKSDFASIQWFSSLKGKSGPRTGPRISGPKNPDHVIYPERSGFSVRSGQPCPVSFLFPWKYAFHQLVHPWNKIIHSQRGLNSRRRLILTFDWSVSNRLNMTLRKVRENTERIK